MLAFSPNGFGCKPRVTRRNLLFQALCQPWATGILCVGAKAIAHVKAVRLFSISCSAQAMACIAAGPMQLTRIGEL